MKRARVGQLVIIDWLDAATHLDGWNDAPDNRPESARSVGIITGLSSKAVTLAADYGPREKHRGHVNRVITIPRGMVKAIRVIGMRDLARLEAAK
jgi:hypothetical protein